MGSITSNPVCRGVVGVLAVSVLVFAAAVTNGDEASELNAQLVAARAALKTAQAAERDANSARGSLDMARAATGAIVDAAKVTVGRSDRLLKEAQDLLKQQTLEAQDAAKKAAAATDPKLKKALQQQAAEAAVEQAALEKLVAERTIRNKTYRDRLAKDQGVANRALEKFSRTQSNIEKSILVTWSSVRDVQAIEAKIAGCAAQKAAGDEQVAQKTLATVAAAAITCTQKCAAEKDPAKKKTLQAAVAKTVAAKLAAEKTHAAKTLATKAAAEKVAAAEKTLRQTVAVAAMDTQGWNVTELAASQKRLRTKTAAAALAKQAAVEKDPAKKRALQASAAKAAAEKAEAEKAVAKQQATVEADVARVYSLRAAAMGGLNPLSPDAWNYKKARHLLVRAGFGGTPAEVQKLCEMGLYKAVDHLVYFHRQPAANAPFDAVPPPAVDPLKAKQRIATARNRAFAAQPRAVAYGAQQEKLVRWWLKRMVESPRPLQEKLTLFWHGHFATQASVVKNSHATYHHNQMLREGAAGNFGTLLYGIVHDPQMIRFLDNNSNVKGHANENLAREIMELFAMGASQGYNEVDVREAARALTGYGVDAQSGQFRYTAAKHDESPKSIFGRKGNWTGDDLVKLILEQPATSRFVSLRMFEFFAYQEPDEQTVERLSSVLRENNYELVPLLKNMFLSEEFYSSRSMGRQIKSPVQLAIGTLRAMGVRQVADAGMLHVTTTKMGQRLFEPPDVKGWRAGRSWINSNRVFVRYNSVSQLVRTVPQPGGVKGLDIVALIETGGCQNCEAIVDLLIKTCFATPLSAEKRAELIKFSKDLPPLDQWAKQRAAVNAKLQSLVVLMTSSPDYQLN